MVFTSHTSKLTINNNLNGLCVIFDEHVCLEIVAKQMVLNMHMIANVHKSMLENVEHVQKK
jgi:DNA polymerase sigma